MDLPTYTNIWRIEKRLYKLYDFRLPMPLPVGQIAVFAAIAVPYVVILKVLGLPFSHTLLWLYILPPAALAWLVTRPVLESKRLPELVVSQLRYLSEPRTWCRMVPLAEKDEIVITARVWRRVGGETRVVSQPAVADVAGMANVAADMAADVAAEWRLTWQMWLTWPWRPQRPRGASRPPRCRRCRCGASGSGLLRCGPGRRRLPFRPGRRPWRRPARPSGPISLLAASGFPLLRRPGGGRFPARRLPAGPAARPGLPRSLTSRRLLRFRVLVRWGGGRGFRRLLRFRVLVRWGGGWGFRRLLRFRVLVRWGGGSGFRRSRPFRPLARSAGRVRFPPPLPFRLLTRRLARIPMLRRPARFP